MELVGRGTPLSLLAGLSSDVRGGAGEVLPITGEVGIGKSVLLGACAEVCAGAGFEVLQGQGDELGTVRPFAPVLRVSRI